jgi:signal transduction histidine kinase
MLPTNHEEQSLPLPLKELEPALALVLTLQQTEVGILMLRDEGTGALAPVLGRGLTNDQLRLFAGHPLTGPFGQAVSSMQRVSIPDAFDTELGALARQLSFRAVDIFPLCRAEGPPFGVVAVMFSGVGTRADTYPAVDLCTKMLVCMLDNAYLRHTAQQHQEHAERIAKDKVEFLARVSHELRNPLNAISGYLELLRLDFGNHMTEPQSILLDRVCQSSRILGNIIEDLITFARLEVGHMHYDIAPVSVYEIVDAAALIVRPLAAARGQHFHVHVPDRRLAVHADGARVRQILTNLLTNGVKFTSQGGSVQLTCTGLDEHTVQFTVSDTGSGIPRDQLDKIFCPYVQVGVPLGGGLDGSGLGLAISRDLAAGMRGSLNADSVVGQGSTFTLVLPRARPLARRTRPKQRPASPLPAAPTRQSPLPGSASR